MKEKFNNLLKDKLNEEIENQNSNLNAQIEAFREEADLEKIKKRKELRRLEDLFEGTKGMLLRKMEEMLESGKCFAKSLVLEESAMRIQQDKNLLSLLQGNHILINRL